MRCPYCSDSVSRVIDSRMGRDGNEIRRRRECLECQRRFTTRERVEEVFPKVVKRDERREDYQRDKLLTAVQKACEKRPVSAPALDQLVDRVERHVQELGEKEITSGLIGQRMMVELVSLDHLAAARFASVFLDFQGADDYRKFFDSIEQPE
ncbi:MAG: transcriptional repressor NrdR [Deltaproteobacteria bacterium]|nr:transcriptional repressor NrdR [Deltaproteobacteria bacterium]